MNGVNIFFLSQPTDAVMQDEVLMRPVTPGQMKDGQAPRTR